MKHIQSYDIDGLKMTWICFPFPQSGNNIITQHRERGGKKEQGGETEIKKENTEKPTKTKM